MTRPAVRFAAAIEQKVSGFDMFRVLAPSAEPQDGGRLRRPRFSAATKLTAPHALRVPRVTLDQTVLQAAAEAFASGEIDRAELMRRVTRVNDAPGLVEVSSHFTVTSPAPSSDGSITPRRSAFYARRVRMGSADLSTLCPDEVG